MSDETPVVPVPKQGFVLGNKLYDKLKFLVQVILPAAGVLYASLAQFWGFPRVEEVVGSITALALFLGLLLGQSAKNFITPPVGDFDVVQDENGKFNVTLGFDQDPSTLVNNSELKFRVNRLDSQTPPE